MERKYNSSIAVLLFRVLLAVAVIGALFFLWRIVTAERAYTTAENAYADIAAVVIRTDEQASEESAPVEDTASNTSRIDWTEQASQESAPMEDTASNTSRIDWTVLWAVNPEAVAWFSCGEVASYPVMQGNNNEFYLRHLADGSYSIAGCLYVDYRCTGDFSGRNTVIYGHNMKNDSMFGFLKNYREQAYYDGHSAMQLDTPDGNYTVELLAAYVQMVDKGYDVPTDFASEEETKAYVEAAQSTSTFESAYEYQKGDRIVTLVSCTPSSKSTERFFVIGRLVGQQK